MTTFQQIIYSPDMSNHLTITQQEVDDFIQPLLEHLKTKMIDPVGINMFRHAAIMGCKNVPLVLDSYKTGELKHDLVVKMSLEDAITRLAIYRIMLERAEGDIYRECTVRV